MAYDRREQDLNEDKKDCTVRSRLTFTGCLLHICYGNEVVYSESE